MNKQQEEDHSLGSTPERRHRNSNTLRRYSDAFKRKVVAEIADGTYTKHEAVQVYGMSHPALRRWIKQAGKTELLNRIMEVKVSDDVSRMDQLESELTQLKQTLAEAHVRNRLLEGYLQVACERLDEDPEGFKKKHEPKP